MLIGMQLTTRCDRACVHCFVDLGHQDLPIEVCREVADHALRLPDARVSFTGGEPTLHPRFAEVLEVFVSRRLRFSMVTNGWSYRRAHPILRASAGSLDLLSFSLDGATVAEHDAIRGRGSFDRVMEAARLCRDDGLPFGFRMTVTRSNLGEVEAMTAVAREAGALEVTFIPSLPTPQLAASGRVLRPEDHAQLLRIATRLQSGGPVRVRLAAGAFSADVLRPCPTLAMQTLFLTADGRLRFCCQLREGNGADGNDLGQIGVVPMADAHHRWTQQVTEVVEDKRARLAAGRLSWAEHHACWYCLKRFGRVEWIRDAGLGAWSEDLRRRPLAGAERVPA